DCTALFLHWFHNWRSGRCELFIYGGCGGNANNFETREECQRTCVPSGKFPAETPGWNLLQGLISKASRKLGQEKALIPPFGWMKRIPLDSLMMLLNYLNLSLDEPRPNYDGEERRTSRSSPAIRDPAVKASPTSEGWRERVEERNNVTQRPFFCPGPSWRPSPQTLLASFLLLCNKALDPGFPLGLWCLLLPLFPLPCPTLMLLDKPGSRKERRPQGSTVQTQQNLKVLPSSPAWHSCCSGTMKAAHGFLLLLGLLTLLVELPPSMGQAGPGDMNFSPMEVVVGMQTISRFPKIACTHVSLQVGSRNLLQGLISKAEDGKQRANNPQRHQAQENSHYGLRSPGEARRQRRGGPERYCSHLQNRNVADRCSETNAGASRQQAKLGPQPSQRSGFQPPLLPPL
ncbi:putative Kunitz-type serine protease inhibitor protein, partial [Naja naja]